MRAQRARSKGFTLVELMIVLAIIAILVALAYPSYRQHVMKTKRADAEGVMVELSQALERNFTEANSYTVDGTGAAWTIPAELAQSPKGTGTPDYTLAVTNTDSVHYLITATPQGAQANDSCGSLTLSESGAKGASGGTTANCW